jgi:hypothetical protein
MEKGDIPISSNSEDEESNDDGKRNIFRWLNLKKLFYRTIKKTCEKGNECKKSTENIWLIISNSIFRNLNRVHLVMEILDVKLVL